MSQPLTWASGARMLPGVEESTRSDPGANNEAFKGPDRVGRALRVWLSRRRVVLSEPEPRMERYEHPGRRP